MTTQGAPSNADLGYVQNLALAYWSAYNAYDADKALSYLEEGYRGAIGQTVRNEVGQLKSAGVTLGITPKGWTKLTGADQAMLKLKMETPTGTRDIVMKFARIGGIWRITSIAQA